MSTPLRTRARGRRAAVLPVLAALAAALLGGCVPTVTGGWTEDGEQAGYSSGDGSVAVYPAGEREGPVELAGTDYAGEAVDLADWRGDVVVLNTWYAACPPCRAEAPDLVALAEDYADRGVRLLGINSTDDPGAALPFERTFGVPYPSLHDDQSRAVAALSGIVPIQATPTTVVLDQEGRVAARVLGQVDGTTLRSLVDDLLAEAA